MSEFITTNENKLQLRSLNRVQENNLNLCMNLTRNILHVT